MAHVYQRLVRQPHSTVQRGGQGFGIWRPTHTAFRTVFGDGSTRPVTQMGAGDEELVKALRGIRGTSAAYARAFAVLFLAIVFGPYRRGETWAWWALMAAMAQIVLVVVGLLLDFSRLRTSNE